MRTLPWLAVLALAACDDSGGSPDAVQPIDASAIDTRVYEGPDAEELPDAWICKPAECVLPEDFGDVGTISGAPNCTASAGATTGNRLTRINVNAGAYHMHSVLLSIEPGYTVFKDGLKTGTFTLEGDELNEKTCGVCVMFFGDMSTPTEMDYWVTGGTVEITSINGTFAGTLTDVSFERAYFAPDFVTTNCGDCYSHINSLSWEAPL